MPMWKGYKKSGWMKKMMKPGKKMWGKRMIKWI